MKHKTLFRLGLKLIGVWLFVSGATSFVSYVVYLVANLFQTWGGSTQPWIFIFQILGPIVQIAVGAYLFFDGKWIADKAIQGNRPYCHECGYDLTGAVGHACTECGTPFKAAEQNQ